MQLLIVKFIAIHEPKDKIVIDESMIPFRGCLLFRQYLPGTSHRYGIKVFKLCDYNGYTYNMSIYTGKMERSNSLSTDIALKLSELYWNAGRTFFCLFVYRRYIIS